MRRFVVACLGIVVVLTLASCGGAGSDPISTGTGGEPTAVGEVDNGAGVQGTADPDLLLVPDSNGHFSATAVVQCSGSPTFVAGALDSPLLARDSTVADGALSVFDEFINNEEGAWWPQDGYWVLTNTDTELLLAHIGTQSEVTLIGSKLVDGTWQPTAIQSGGPCPIQVPLPEGVHEVDWRLDPSVPVDETSTTVSLLATGRACSGGQPMLDRLREPQVLLTADTVYLVLIADRPTGAQTCPGNPDEPVIVDLGEPIGARQVVNARLVAGSLPDYLPVSPCGQLLRLAGQSGDDEPVALSGPPERTQCE